ncbi:MAG: hypothetical protein PW735_08785 [Acidobacteriaceae bacterium]|nr:hypothetical protein [Acidobacteriaceae bacterium]
MVTPTDLSLWLDQQAWFFLLLAGLILFIYLALRQSARKRRQTLQAQREGVTELTFTEHMEQFGYDPVVCLSTYRYLQQVQRVSFPILPADALEEDLGLAQEDVEQSVRELTAALGRYRNIGLVNTPLETVEDLVQLLQTFPEAETLPGRALA